MESSTAVPVHAASTGSTTIADLIGLAAARHGDAPAVRHKADGEWRDVSYAQLGEIVSEVGRGLVDLGIEPGDRVAILCTTRPEWSYADFGITSAGAVVVPIYPTNSPEECEWVAGNSESRAIVCEDAAQVAKIREVHGNLPALETIIVVDPSRRRRRRDPARDPARARPGARPGRARRADRRRHARPAVHDHLHVGDDRPAEGLRPHPRQLPLGRLHVRARRGRPGRRHGVPVPAPRALVRAAHPARRVRPRGDARLLRRRPEADHRRALRGQADLPAVRPADLREALHARHRARRPRADQGGHAGRAEGPAAPGRRAGGARRAAGALRRRRGGALQERPRRVRRAAAPGDVGRGADRAGDPRVLLRLRRAGARGLRHDGDGDRGDGLDDRLLPLRLGRQGAARASRSGSPTTARCCSRARTSSRATTRTRTRRSARSRTAGCTRATSAASTRTASCSSPAARRTSSSPRAARTSRRPTSRTTSSSRAGSPRRSCTATAARTRSR